MGTESKDFEEKVKNLKISFGDSLVKNVLKTLDQFEPDEYPIYMINDQGEDFQLKFFDFLVKNNPEAFTSLFDRHFNVLLGGSVEYNPSCEDDIEDSLEALLERKLQYFIEDNLDDIKSSVKEGLIKKVLYQHDIDKFSDDAEKVEKIVEEVFDDIFEQKMNEGKKKRFSFDFSMNI